MAGMFGDRSRVVVMNGQPVQEQQPQQDQPVVAQERQDFADIMEALAREDAAKVSAIRDALGITQSRTTPFGAKPATAAPETSLRPQARPEAPTESLRPVARPEPVKPIEAPQAMTTAPMSLNFGIIDQAPQRPAAAEAAPTPAETPSAPVAEGAGVAAGDTSGVLAPVAPGYKQSQVVSYSYYNTPVSGSGLRGNSRRGGDASAEVQNQAINAIITEGRNQGMSDDQIALTLAIARHESGFNPDAAAGTTSAHGLGQFVNKTGEAYGLNDENRWDLNAQAKALVAHTLDNIALANKRGQGVEYVYKYHHDGPSKDYGGLGIAKKSVVPMIDKMLGVVQGAAPASPTPPQAQTQSRVTAPADPNSLGMIGGVKDDKNVWQSFDGSGMAHSADYKDYSQLFREYTTEQKEGYVPVGEMNGQTVYASPDYAKDENGNYISVNKDEAVALAAERGSILPTREMVKELYAKSTRIPMAIQPIGETGGTGDTALYTQKINEAVAQRGVKPGQSIVHGKEFFLAK